MDKWNVELKNDGFIEISKGDTVICEHLETIYSLYKGLDEIMASFADIEYLKQRTLEAEDVLDFRVKVKDLAYMLSNEGGWIRREDMISYDFDLIEEGE